MKYAYFYIPTSNYLFISINVKLLVKKQNGKGVIGYYSGHLADFLYNNNIKIQVSVQYFIRIYRYNLHKTLEM